MEKLVLHVGAGKERTIHPIFDGWKVKTLDIDASLEPDIVDDIVTLKTIGTETCDGIYSSHNLEHLNFLDFEQALVTFHRVLKPGGLLVAVVPDFELACKRVAEGRMFEAVYTSPAGPITAVDMIFGYIQYTRNNPYQCHRIGFTKDMLQQSLFRARFFAETFTTSAFDIWAFAKKIS